MTRLDIAADGPPVEPSTHTGDQRTHDIRAVQLRAANFSPAMIQKAGRLYVAGMWEANGDQAFQVLGDSDEWHTVRVWGSLTWLATCTCPARASRWNRSGACAHRALGGWLRSQIIKRPIPRWPDLYFAALTQEEPRDR